MKQFIVAIFLCVAFSALVDAAERKMAYDRGGKIFVADVDGPHSKKIADGSWPAISPEGTRVAFNTEGDAKNRPGPERHIAIADVGSGKVTVLPNIPSDNCFGPVWSPDEKQLAFFNYGRERVAPRPGERRRFRLSLSQKCRAKARSVWRAGMGTRRQIDFLPRSRQHLPHRSGRKRSEEMGALEDSD